MRFSYRNIAAAVFALAIGLPFLSLPLAIGETEPLVGAATSVEPKPGPGPTPPDPQAQQIENRDRRENGITVGEPRVYDDAQLQQRLQELEARLATLQPLDQKPLTDRLGSVSGASQQTSGTGFNIQGPSVPGVETLTKLPTTSTKATTAAGSTNTAFETTSGLATEDVKTTSPQFNPPTATAPAPTTTMPSAFSVSSSDVLNEMTQLTAEINGLRLMLSGDLSSHYIRGGPELGNKMTKLNTTLGFNISVKTDERYKDAIAIVEVEVENVCPTVSNEPPSITALLPREKTYNVATITDKSTSIGGGVATQIIGFSGSWVRGHKTHYIVQDQDTVALTFTPEEQPGDTCPVAGGSRNKKRVGFLWQFRPVLGRRFVRIADKTTFVRLALPVPPDAADGGIGTVTVRSYWRRYDHKSGVQKAVIPGSVREHFVDANPFDIPRYHLAVDPDVFNFRDNLEDLGGGQMLVKLPGRFLPGTNVRIGPVVLSEGDRFKHRYSGIRFVAPLFDLATKRVFLVGHDGTEVDLKLLAPAIRLGFAGFAVHACGATEERDAAQNLLRRYTTKFEVSGNPAVATIDEANSRLSLDFIIKQATFVVATGTTTVTTYTPTASDEIPTLALTVGTRVFSIWEGSLKRAGNRVTAVVPSALLSTSPEVTLQLILPGNECRTTVSLPEFDLPSQAERLVVLEQGADKSKFLLYGSRLAGLTVVAPSGVVPQNIGNPADPNRLLLIVLDAAQLKSHKQLVVQRPTERPFLIPIPALEAPKKPDPPKAKERVTVGSDEAVIEGEGLKDVTKVFFKKRPFNPRDIEIADDGKSVRLAGLRDFGVTLTAMSQPLVLELKSGAKVTVILEVVNAKMEMVTK